MYQQLNLKTKIKKQAEQKQDHRYRECLDSCQTEGVERMDEKGEEIKYKLVVPGTVTGMLRTA